MARDAYGFGTPKVPFDRTMKNRQGLPRQGLYPNYYDEGGNYIGLNETPAAGTGLKKNMFGMPEAWQYAPTGKSLDTSEIDFSNKDQVMAIQSAIGADVDGVWGPQTEKLYREAINQRRGQMGLESYSYEPEPEMYPAGSIVMPGDPDAGSLFDLAQPANSFEAYQMYNPRMRR